VVALLGVLADHSMDDGLQDILFGQDELHVLNQVEGLGDFVVLEVVNYQVKSCFWDDFNEGRKDL